jgi:hypothetical protein
MIVDALPDIRLQPNPCLIVTTQRAERKDVYDSIDDHVVRQAQLLRGPGRLRHGRRGMHPIGCTAYLMAFPHLARRGFHVIGAAPVTNGDASLQMENVLLDLGACVGDPRAARLQEYIPGPMERWWLADGGCQGEAEQITPTAAGEHCPLADTELSPADGLLRIAGTAAGECSSPSSSTPRSATRTTRTTGTRR